MQNILFDWGNTLMLDLPGQTGPMCDWPEVVAVNNAVATLAQLSKTVKCHLATNAQDSSEDQIRKALIRAGLDTFIDRIFCFKAIGHAKPSDAYFSAIASELNVARSDLVMVGDDLDKDVRGALSCGLQAIWYNPGSLDVPTGITAVSDLAELPEVINKYSS